MLLNRHLCDSHGANCVPVGGVRHDAPQGQGANRRQALLEKARHMRADSGKIEPDGTSEVAPSDSRKSCAGFHLTRPPDCVMER
ncbi:hypothetical protein PSP6_520004 [Paraburkholderia tropica]|nr:hypothetical protein PSP6_520004 [Paraburkholderia tropica]